jgi:hypothetical protein
VLLADVSGLSLSSMFIGRWMKMEPIESSETSANNTQTPGTYSKESKLHLKHGENLKSRRRSGLGNGSNRINIQSS